MNIVLDKSYLQGAGREEIHELCRLHSVIMPESLFFELLTAEPDVRARCFSKLPAVDNPVILAPHSGTILRHEINNGAPCRDIMKIAINIPYKFNEELIGPNFKISDEQQRSISEWKSDFAAQVEGFKEKSACISGWFPELEGFAAGSNPEPIDKAKASICKDQNMVKTIYESIRHTSFPNAELITVEWALFRWVQVHVFAALEYVWKYGDGNSAAVSRKIENEFLDLDYCVTALIVGALASRDNGMIEKFRCMRPDGTVIDHI